jgi:hypothetical protein
MIRVFILVFFAIISASAQRILPQVWFNENNISDKTIKMGDKSILYGLGQSNIELKGDYFWEEDFLKANVYFYPQQIASINGGLINLDSLFGEEVRFDLWNNNIEFRSEGGIKVISAASVSHVLLLNPNSSVSQFINPKEFTSLNEKGLFELLNSKNDAAVLQSKEILIQKPNYNPALDTGNKEPQITKKDHFHYWDGLRLVSIDNKSEVLQLLNYLGFDAKKYLKNSKNRLNSSGDYKNLAHFIFECQP